MLRSAPRLRPAALVLAAAAAAGAAAAPSVSFLPPANAHEDGRAGPLHVTVVGGAGAAAAVYVNREGGRPQDGVLYGGALTLDAPGTYTLTAAAKEGDAWGPTVRHARHTARGGADRRGGR